MFVFLKKPLLILGPRAVSAAWLQGEQEAGTLCAGWCHPLHSMYPSRL